MPWTLANRRGVGIAARLSVSFLVVAALAILANIVAEHGISVVTTTTIQAPALTTLLNAQVSPATLQGSPQGAHHIALQDLRPPALKDFIQATAHFERATEAELHAQKDGQTSELTLSARQLEASSQALMAVSAGPSEFDVKPFLARARALQRNGELLVAADAISRARFKTYWIRVAALDGLLKSTLDHNWQIFGRVFARQSLLKLIAEANDIRSAAVQMISAKGIDTDSVALVEDREGRFASTLNQHRAELLRSQGPVWLEQLTRAFADVVTGRTNIAASAVQLSHARSAYDLSAAAMDSLAGTATASTLSWPAVQAAVTDARFPGTQALSPGASGPALAPLSTATDRSRTTTETLAPFSSLRLGVAATSAVILFLLLGVSIATVRSIVRPIRQFMATTSRLAAGEATARFERGGIAELDSLAVSLNGMAQTLELAQTATREYQDALEVRIDQRTRQLQHLALHDSLTGLPNRRQLHAHLSQALLTAATSNTHVALFFIDLDNFKNINDSMGHTFGDRVLQAIAHRLRETTISEGLASRLGGDEFMVVYSPAGGSEDAARLGEMLVTAFRQPLLVEARELLVSVSVGGSVFPDHADSVDSLLRAADTALFSAKTLGRNQFSLFTHELLERAAKKFDIEQGLRRAVERNEFELFFQPEVEFQECRAVLAEALLRWRHPERSHMSPAHFLAIAKESGLNTRISDWVLRSAVEKVEEWRAGPWPEARVAINVSATQLIGTRFVDQVEELLSAHNVPPHCLEIELTEDILQTGPSTIGVLRQLRDLGLSIALDDFGTGFSTFSSLQQLPLTRVKLDQSLVAAVDTDGRSAAIAGAIIKLCAELGLTVTAEGIERVPQLALLLDFGPICFQGYLIEHPLSAAALPGAITALPSKLRALSAHLASAAKADRLSRTPRQIDDPLFLDLEASQSA